MREGLKVGKDAMGGIESEGGWNERGGEGVEVRDGGRRGEVSGWK